MKWIFAIAVLLLITIIFLFRKKNKNKHEIPYQLHLPINQESLHKTFEQIGKFLSYIDLQEVMQIGEYFKKIGATISNAEKGIEKPNIAKASSRAVDTTKKLPEDNKI